MKNVDESALVCDFAETYHVLEMKALPVQQVALLAYGLGESSRIMMKLSAKTQTFEKMMLAICADYLALLVWQRTKDGSKGKNRPKSIYTELSKTKKEFETLEGFATIEEFEKHRAEILERGG